MKDWLEEFAAALGVAPLSREETGEVLKLARDVARGVERKFAPLSSYLLGVAVGGRAVGASRSNVFEESMARGRTALPLPSDDVGAP